VARMTLWDAAIPPLGVHGFLVLRSDLLWWTIRSQPRMNDCHSGQGAARSSRGLLPVLDECAGRTDMGSQCGNRAGGQQTSMPAPPALVRPKKSGTRCDKPSSGAATYSGRRSRLQRMAQIVATATRRVGGRGIRDQGNVVSHHGGSMLDVQQLLREVDMNTGNRKECHPPRKAATSKVQSRRARLSHRRILVSDRACGGLNDIGDSGAG
jgi:hypothetical protein